MSERDDQHGGASGAALENMTFGEISRYLQSGYATPVQRAISAHVMYSNAAADELDSIKTLRRLGHEVMTTYVAEMDLAVATEEETLLVPELLAAYLDGVLSPDEAAVVSERIANSYACYQQYAGLQRELATPVPARLHAPAKALALVRQPVPDASQRQPFMVRLLLRLADWVMTWLDQHWRATALSLAIGLFALFALLPVLQGPDTIALQPFVVDEQGAQVLSGQPQDAPAETAERAIFPADTKARLVFTWSARTDVEAYLFSTTTEDGMQVIIQQETDSTLFSLDRALLTPGQPYHTLVLARYTSGDTGPVAFLDFSIE